VLANCLHSFTDRGKNLKIKKIGVKAKVKAKDRNDGEGEGSEGKKQHYYSVCAHAREEERKRGRRSASHSRFLPLNRLTLDYGGGAFHDFPLRLTYLRSSFFFL
jgi:hypothetical protein